MSSSRKKSVSTTPHFFKIIVDDNIRHLKLAIPRKFIRDCGDNLPKKLLLRVPSGKAWPIQLVERDGDVWLQQGWEELAKFYYLAHGHLIVFRFEGNGDFRILIFDKSASEIEYPCLSSHGQSELDVEEVTSDDLSSEKSDKTVGVKRTRPSMCRRSSKRIKTNAADNCYGGVLRSQADNGLKDVPKGGGWDVTRTMKQPAIIENDKKFEISASENLSFSVVMQASYLRTRSTLDIPSNFAKKHLTKGIGLGDAILRISDNRTRPIKYSCEASKENPRAKIYNGWSTFARDNNLKVGDVCVFELIQNVKVLFTVSISPEADDTNSRQETNVMEATSIKLKPVKVVPDSAVDYDTRSPSRQKTLSNFQLRKTRSRGAENSTIQRSEESTFDRRNIIPSLTREEKPKALERANSSFKSKNSSFTVAIRPAYIYGGAGNLPFKFVKDYLMNDKNREVTLRFSGKSWTVGLRVTTHAGKPSIRKAIFGSNWRGFVQDNSLKVGDTCVFELTEGVKSLLNVVVIRVKDCSLSRCE